MCIRDRGYTEATLGYATAVNVCVEAVRSIRATSRSHDPVSDTHLGLVMMLFQQGHKRPRQGFLVLRQQNPHPSSQ